MSISRSSSHKISKIYGFPPKLEEVCAFQTTIKNFLDVKQIEKIILNSGYGL
jgi:hypothetical protein